MVGAGQRVVVLALEPEPVAAMSASGPSYRLRPSRFDDMAGVVMAGAAEISARIGYLGS